MDEEQYLEMLRSLLPNAYGDNYWKVFNTESAGDTLPPYEVTSMNVARRAMGNALEQAVGEHVWSDWQTVVEPDDTHDGLAVHHCENCGTEESMPVPYVAPALIMGDADVNHDVSFADVSAIYMHLIGLDTLSDQGCLNSDMNLNGFVDYSDISLLYLFLVNDSE